MLERALPRTRRVGVGGDQSGGYEPIQQLPRKNLQTLLEKTTIEPCRRIGVPTRRLHGEFPHQEEVPLTRRCRRLRFVFYASGSFHPGPLFGQSARSVASSLW